MAGTLTPTPYQTVLDADGVAVSGALIYTYVGGTTTAATTYADASLATPNTNPIVADSAGRFVAYLPAGGNFKFTYKTAAGATIEEQDNILSVPGAAVNLDIEGTVGEAVTAGQVCYLSTGAEAIPLTAGLWYLTDADFAPTSTTCQSIGVAVSAIAINTAGTIRLAGTATTASAVVIGSTYYVSATAGAITATAPALSRTVGVALTTSTLLLAATTAVVTPGGSNTQVQFNDNGALNGDAGFTYIKATDAVAIGGPLAVTGAATLSSTVATGALTVTGAATVSTTLGVTGATTLSSTVATGALTVTGAATVSTTLGVTGAITSATSVALTGTTNNLGTITTGVWNAGAVTSSGPFSLTGSTSATFAVGGTSSILLDATSNYNVLSLINSTSLTSNVGLFGGASGDATSLYFIAATGGAFQWRSGATGDFMTLSSAGLLTVSGFGTHNFSAGAAGANTVMVANTTSGAANYSAFKATGGTTQGYLYAFTQGYTTSGPYMASTVTLQSTGSAGLNLLASEASGKIRFYSGGTAERGGFTSSGSFYVGPTGAETVQLTAGGSVVANFAGSSYNYAAVTGFSGGTIAYYSSDRRLKKNIEPIRDGLTIVRQLQPSTFDLIVDDYHASGFIAQDVLGLVPGAATVTPNDGMLAFNVTAKAIQELDQQVTQHDTRLAVLEAKLLAAGV